MDTFLIYRLNVKLYRHNRNRHGITHPYPQSTYVFPPPQNFFLHKIPAHTSVLYYWYQQVLNQCHHLDRHQYWFCIHSQRKEKLKALVILDALSVKIVVILWPISYDDTISSYTCLMFSAVWRPLKFLQANMAVCVDQYKMKCPGNISFNGLTICQR